MLSHKVNGNNENSQRENVFYWKIKFQNIFTHFLGTWWIVDKIWLCLSVRNDLLCKVEDKTPCTCENIFKKTLNLLQEKRVVFYPNSTGIRRNPYYYTIYCIALNTCFGTLLPLTALIYLNCMTLLGMVSN